MQPSSSSIALTTGRAVSAEGPFAISRYNPAVLIVFYIRLCFVVIVVKILLSFNFLCFPAVLQTLFANIWRYCSIFNSCYVILLSVMCSDRGCGDVNMTGTGLTDTCSCDGALTLRHWPTSRHWCNRAEVSRHFGRVDQTVRFFGDLSGQKYDVKPDN